MPQPIAPFNPALASSGTISTGVAGRGELLLQNSSGYKLLLTDDQNNGWYLNAWQERVVPICGTGGLLNWAVASPPLIVSNASPYSLVTGEAYKTGEAVGGTYPTNGPLLTNPSAQEHVASVTINGNSSQYVTIGPVPAGTNALIVYSGNLNALNYEIQVFFHDTGFLFLSQSARPQPQFAVFPLLPSGDGQYIVYLTNSTPGGVIYDLAVAAGGLPMPVQPVEGMIRTTTEVVSAGDALYQALSPTGDAGTVRWVVANTATTGVMYVMDSGLIALQAASTALYAMIRKATYPGGTVVSEIGTIQNVVGAQTLTGPVMIPPGYQLQGYTYNETGASQFVTISATYHTVPL